MQGNMGQYQGKLTLLDLREKYGINIVQLADRSGVEPSVVYCMLLDRPVKRLEAFRVIEGLSKLVGVGYTLSDFDVALVDDRF